MPSLSIAVNGKALIREEGTGVTRVARELVRHLPRTERDVRVHVYVPAPAPGPTRDLGEWAAGARIHASVSPLFSSGGGRSLWEQFILPRVVRGGGHDVLLNPSNSAPTLISPGLPQVLTIHDSGFLRPEWFRPGFSLYLRLILSRASRASVWAVAPSGSSARHLEARFPGLAPISVIHDAVSPPPPALAPWREEAPYVLFLGSRNPRKNREGAVRGFLRFHEAGDPGSSLLLLVGSSGRSIHRRDVRGEILEHQAIRDEGWVDDHTRWRMLRGARLLLVPSFLEGFGLPILEAFHVGTPVVASDMAVFRELYGNAVEYIDPRDPSDIARGIEAVFGDAARRRDLVRRGARVAARFSWQRVAREYLELLAGAAEGGSRQEYR